MEEDGVELEIIREDDKKNEEEEGGDHDQLVLNQNQKPDENLTYPVITGFVIISLVILIFIIIGVFVVITVYLETSTIIMYKKTAHSIVQQARDNAEFPFSRLTNFSDKFPARISSSQNAVLAAYWVQSELVKDGFTNVRLQEVSVPNWNRNTGESLKLLSPRPQNMRILSLGNSVATPEDGIVAEVLVVSSWEDLDKRGNEASGKIVLFNVPFTNYSDTVQYRINGANNAAKYNAKAALIRSITPFSLQTPHTGVMYYNNENTQIPTAAITIEDAQYLQRLQDQGVRIEVELHLYCETLPDAIAYNVIGEIIGSELPDEVVLIGGHIDSWDVGNGAMDDGGGLIATWEACRIIKNLGLNPRRTIRFIGWVDEENRSSGAQTYFDLLSEEEIKNHILAIESDSGVFTPKSITFSQAVDSDQWDLLNNIVTRLMKDIGPLSLVSSSGGEDTQILRQAGVPVSELLVDESTYFWYHHTEADTIDKLDKNQLADCVATLSILTYVIADFEKSLTSLSASV